MRKKLVKVAFTILAFLALGLGIMTFYLHDTKASTGDDNPIKAPMEQAVKVGVKTIEPESIKDVLVLPGETKASQDVVLSAEQGGLVEWVGPKEGDRVEKGDLLVRIEVETLKTEYENAMAAYHLADKQYERRSNLFKERIIPREELDQSRTDRSMKQGAARAAKIRYLKGFVRAPISGMVNRVHVDPGEFVGEGAPVVELVNTDRVEVEVSMPELDVKYFRPGQKAMVTVDAYADQQFLGDIEFVAFKADGLTKTFRVKILLDNSAGLIRPGMMVRAYMLRRVVPDALAVPLFALLDKGGERVLFVAENGRAQSRMVRLGIIDNDRVQILEGLQPGDQLIVTGQTEVEDGIKVVLQ